METKFGLDLVLGSVVLNQVMPDSNLINGTDFSEVVKVRKKSSDFKLQILEFWNTTTNFYITTTTTNFPDFCSFIIA